MPESCPPYGPGYDPETAVLRADLTEIAAERDQYAAEARALRHQLADADTREQFLNHTIHQLRAALALRERHAPAA